MKISALVHAVIDYATVLLLLIAPAMVGMKTVGVTFTYVLAIVHLVLTLVTDFKGGVFRLVPFKIHGLIEIIVAVLLVGVAVWFKTSGDNVSFYFYLIFSIVLFIVWGLSDYRRAG